MSIQGEIGRLSAAKASIAASLQAMGVDPPSGTTLEQYAAQLAAIAAAAPWLSLTGGTMTGKQVYNEPANMFVAGFIGSPAMNFIRGAIDDRYFVTETLRLEIPEDKLAVLNAQGYQRKAVVFAFNKLSVVGFHLVPTARVFDY